MPPPPLVLQLSAEILEWIRVDLILFAGISRMSMAGVSNDSKILRVSVLILLPASLKGWKLYELLKMGADGFSLHCPG